MTPEKKIWPATGGEKRKKSQSLRSIAMRADVTEKEKQAILKHCLTSKISVSQFLADLALADIENKNSYEEEITIKFSRDQIHKLLLIARLNAKSVNDLIAEHFAHLLTNKQPHGSVEMQSLTLYVNPEEHERLKEHIEPKGFSARNYVGMLAVEYVEQLSRMSAHTERRKQTHKSPTIIHLTTALSEK